MIVTALLIADVDGPQTSLRGLEGIDSGCGSLADSGDFSGGSFADGFFLSFELLEAFRIRLGHGTEHTINLIRA